MRKYDLAKMLEEIRRDEGSTPVPSKKVLSQEQIRAMALARRQQAPSKKPPAR